MNLRIRFLALVSLAFTAVIPTRAYCIDPILGEVSETRSSGSKATRLELELGIKPSDAAGVSALKATVISAIDDTGRDLSDIPPNERQSGKYFVLSDGGNFIKLRFRNSARKAVSIKEFIGRLDVFMPANDPDNSQIIFEDILSKPNSDIESEALRINGIKISLSAVDAGQGSNRLSFSINTSDSDGKLVNIEVSEERQGVIEPTTVRGTGSIRTFEYLSQSSGRLKLLVHIATQRSVVRVPFSFENIILP